MLFISIAGALLSGWLLGLFGFDTMILNALEEVTGNQYSQSVYYAIFALVAFLRVILITSKVFKINNSDDAFKFDFNKKNKK